MICMPGVSRTQIDQFIHDIVDATVPHDASIPESSVPWHFVFEEALATLRQLSRSPRKVAAPGEAERYLQGGGAAVARAGDRHVRGGEGGLEPAGQLVNVPPALT
ncbi:hypothetical protein NKG94_50295 [Micromonospora sp. M12]